MLEKGVFVKYWRKGAVEACCNSGEVLIFLCARGPHCVPLHGRVTFRRTTSIMLSGD